MTVLSRLLSGSTALLIASCTTADFEAPQTATLTQGVDVMAPVPMPSAPLDKTKTLTGIAFGSCLRQEDDQSIWNTIASSEPDVFMFIGDNVYGDNYSEIPGLPELKKAYATLARSEAFAMFREQTPLLVTWDDHDYGLNDNGASFPHREDSEKLFDFVWDIPEDSASRQRPGVYSAHIIGDEDGKRVQLILLDTRFFRSDLKATDERNAPGKERYLPDYSTDKTMLGDTQWQWLEAELAKPADLRIVASSIQIIANGHGWEAWRTLPKERERLYSLINSSGAENVVFISGDRHSGGIYKRNLVAAYPLYEITSSSLNAPLSAWLDVTSPDFKAEAGPYRIGEMFYDVNYGMIDIDWENREVALRLMDEEGEPVREQIIQLSDPRPVY